MTSKEKAANLALRFGDTQKAILCVEEILKQFDGLHKPEYCAFDAIGERRFTFEGEYGTHMTGYDMRAYWQEVKKFLNHPDNGKNMHTGTGETP